MNNTGLATTIIISIVTQEVIPEASIKDHQQGEDPGPTLGDQWTEEITTDRPFIYRSGHSNVNDESQD